MSRTNIQPALTTTYQGLATTITTSISPGGKRTSSLTSVMNRARVLSEHRSSLSSSNLRATRSVGEPLPQNGFTYWRSEMNYPYIDRNFVSSDAETRQYGYHASDYTCDQDFSRVLNGTNGSNQRNEAIIKLRNKIKDMEVNLAQAYAERQMAIDLVADTIFKLARAAERLRKGDLVGAFRGLPGKISRDTAGKVSRRTRKEGARNAFARNWLELQYGWRPLVSDIYGACAALAKPRPNPWTRAVGTSSRVYHDQRTVANSSTSLVYDTEVKRDWKFTSYFRTTGTVLPTLAQLGLTNPALIAWELTPFSFVVDWVVPIGGWIGGFDALLGIEQISTSETTFISGTNSLQTKYFVRTLTGTDSRTERSSYTYVECKRLKLLGVPVAYLPYVKNPLSFEHCANALALLQQVFLGKKRPK